MMGLPKGYKLIIEQKKQTMQPGEVIKKPLSKDMVERLMQRMDRHPRSTQYFHGKLSSAELGLRGWVLINNFAPWNPMTVKKHGGKLSSRKVEGFRYHDNWLENLLVLVLLGGYRQFPKKTL
jgi:menaquinone-dependent protoporphyrinogen IX oxidase